MPNSESLTDSDYPETLRGFLTREIRQASDGQLAFAATFGVIVTTVALWWHLRGWLFFAVSGVTCGAAALWGITDRHLAELDDSQHSASRILRSCRFVFGALGVVAGAGMILRVLSLALGTWIS